MALSRNYCCPDTKQYLPFLFLLEKMYMIKNIQFCHGNAPVLSSYKIIRIAVNNKSVMYYDCMFVTRHANRNFSALYCIVICGLTTSTIFFTSSHNNTVFWKKKILHLKCVQILPKIFFNLRRIQKHCTVNLPISSCKVSRYSCPV